jgi:hypothetical protein
MLAIKLFYYVSTTCSIEFVFIMIFAAVCTTFAIKPTGVLL